MTCQHCDISVPNKEVVVLCARAYAEVLVLTVLRKTTELVNKEYIPCYTC
jgi:hypothetical protein